MTKNCMAGTARRTPFLSAAAGFTLLELMIAVAIIGILAAIAIPAYTDYITRSRLVDVTNELSGMAVRMEQYYQDNRTFATGAPVGVWPCASGELATINAATRLGKTGFAVSCPTTTATAFTLRAAGSGVTAGFTFEIDQTNARTSTALPTGWGTAPVNCWVMNRGGAC
jgi:type IV pilus assembly protein PilE